LRPGTEPEFIAGTGERIDLLGDAGVEECFFVPFDEHISKLTPQQFIDDVLIAKLRVRAVVTGEKFRFGNARAGDAALARTALEAHGVAFVGVPNTAHDGERISSTRIRGLIAAGKVEEAQTLLGHAYTLRGTVRLGAGRGHDLGFPTANVVPHERLLLPGDGVYAAVARYDGRDYASLVSIGTNPTFEGTARTVEAWLRDFDQTIYGREIALRDFRFVRGQQKFASAEALVERMQLDLEAVAYPSYG
jgi:riboflavin kinase/FMN adenylyltransferase